MAEEQSIKKARRIVSKNNFLRDVSYMFNIEASSIFESDLSGLASWVKKYGFKVKVIGNGDSMAVLCSKKGIDVFMTSRLLTLRVDGEEYRNFNEFSEFLIPFVLDYAREVKADTVDTKFIMKTNSFVLQRENEVSKKISTEQYCRSLFSKNFLSSHTNRGVLKKARDIAVSSQYTVSSTDKTLKVELLLGGMDFIPCSLDDFSGKISNMNDAVYDMWSYSVSSYVKEELIKKMG